MALEIAQLGQPILRQQTQQVSAAEITTPEFQQFIDEMFETLRKFKGIGLAGPQVFRCQRLFLAGVLPAEQEDDEPGFEVFINPELSSLSEEKDLRWEGCLSFMELLVLVPRHTSLHIDYLNRHGEPSSLDLTGFPAQVVQHEYDHLDGILTIDRAPSTHHIIKASELDAFLEAQKQASAESAENS